MKWFRFATIIILLSLFAGCDDFSLYSQFTRDKETEIVEIPGDPTDPTYPTDPMAELVFVITSTTLTSGNSVDVSIVNGRPPYTLTKRDLDVYSSGSVSNDLGMFTETQYTAGKSCGTVELMVIDSAGSIVTQTVTVKPRPVEGLTVIRDQPGNNQHRLEWSYDVDRLPYIQSFEIHRKRDRESVFTKIGDVSNSVTPLQYNDTVSNPQITYYRVIVHAGAFSSQERDVFSPKN